MEPGRQRGEEEPPRTLRRCGSRNGKRMGRRCYISQAGKAFQERELTTVSFRFKGGKDS